MAEHIVDSLAGSTRPIAAAATAVVERNPGGRSPLMLLGDHAGCEIPARLGDLGLPRSQITRHIGWDIGVAELGGALAERLDAAFIAQRFSRLVIDCNRDPARADAICEVSDGARIPGNADLSPAERQARIVQVFSPYHDHIARALDARAAAGRATVLVALHSFTPVMGGTARPWRYGVLHLGGSAFSARTLAALRIRLDEASVGDNQPYRMDETDFTIPHHALGRGLDYVELEVRQDLLADAAGVEAVTDLVAEVLGEALS